MDRDVTMIDVAEVSRLWRAGPSTKRLTAQLGVDPKTARRYVTVAEGVGLRREGPPPSDDELQQVPLALHPAGGRPRGDGWTLCAAHRDRITPAFLEYAQTRGFHVDAVRVRHAQDQGRVERSVPTVRDDCFGGERLADLDAARSPLEISRGRETPMFPPRSIMNETGHEPTV